MCLNSIEYKPKILVIEDDVDIRTIICRVLTKFEFEVQSACDGREALIKLLNNNDRPDVILVDLNMPIMDGYEFLQLMSKNQPISDIPTIVMTAENNNEFLKKKLPGRKIINKPLDINMLVATIKRETVKVNEPPALDL